MTMGRLLLEGKTLYVDGFDHKGPFLFLTEAAGQFIAKGRTGMFVLQIINMFIVLVFLVKTSKIFISSVNGILFILVTFLLLFRLTIGEGNQTEELSLPYIFISIYITFRYYFKSRPLKYTDSLIVSLCFSAIFWIRPNNAGIICACVLFIFIILIRKKQYDVLLKQSLCFLFTFIIFSALICGYFFNIGAFDEMFYAVFLFNFRYIDHSFIYILSHLLIASLFIIIVLTSLFMGTYRLSKMTGDNNIILFSILLLLFGFIPVNIIKVGSMEYKSLIIPVFSIGSMFFFYRREIRSSQEKIMNITSVAIIALLIISFFIRYNFYRNYDSDYENSAQTLMKKIPPSETDKLYGYQVEAKFFVITDLLPSYKYFIFQEWHGKFDKNVLSDINDMMLKNKPLWVFTQNDLMEKSENKIFQNILTNDYSPVHQDNYFKLYRLKEQ